MKTFLILAVLMMGTSAFAQKNAGKPVVGRNHQAGVQQAAPKESEQKPRPVHFMLAYGSEFRPEKDVEGNFSEHVLTNYALGVGYDQFVFILEKAEFKESSGNATLKIERTLEDYLLWAHYRAITWKHLVPFIGAGLGSYKEIVKTTFAGDTTTDESDSKVLSGLAFGVGLDVPVLWFSLEARFLFGDELERQPTIGGLARVGIQF